LNLKANIILFLHDDIANAKANPYPGQVFNRPTKQGEPGEDVYAGCRPDYTGTSRSNRVFVAV
jgi:legumain